MPDVPSRAAVSHAGCRVANEYSFSRILQNGQTFTRKWFFQFLGVQIQGFLGGTPGGGTWIIFGWVCAARDSKLAPRSKKNFP